MILQMALEIGYIVGQYWPQLMPSCLTGLIFGVPGLLLVWAVALNLRGSRRW